MYAGYIFVTRECGVGVEADVCVLCVYAGYIFVTRVVVYR